MNNDSTNNDPQTISVSILEKEYRVSCPPSEEMNLRESARYLDTKMREIREKGRTFGAERIAIMAALNISYELMHKQSEVEAENQFCREELQRLTNKVNRALEPQD